MHSLTLRYQYNSSFLNGLLMDNANSRGISGFCQSLIKSIYQYSAALDTVVYLKLYGFIQDMEAFALRVNISSLLL